MVWFGKFKLSDALRPFSRKLASDKRGKPVPTHETTAEQIREAQESGEAGDANASIRERMIDIGRGNQQAGRQGQ